MVDRVAIAGFGALVLPVDVPTDGWSPRASHEPTPAVRNINMPGSPLPVSVKGVLRADDAVRCTECGVRAVIVSNHGGRHLETTLTTAAAAAVGVVAGALSGKAEVYVDGGIRRGTDILKALALGAQAVLIGRPALWALAVNGANGMAQVMEHLRVKLLRSMQLAGTARPADITSDLVAAN